MQAAKPSGGFDGFTVFLLMGIVGASIAVLLGFPGLVAFQAALIRTISISYLVCSCLGGFYEGVARRVWLRLALVSNTLYFFFVTSWWAWDVRYLLVFDATDLLYQAIYVSVLLDSRGYTFHLGLTVGCMAVGFFLGKHVVLLQTWIEWLDLSDGMLGRRLQDTVDNPSDEDWPMKVLVTIVVLVLGNGAILYCQHIRRGPVQVVPFNVMDPNLGAQVVAVVPVGRTTFDGDLPSDDGSNSGTISVPCVQDPDTVSVADVQDHKEYVSWTQTDDEDRDCSVTAGVSTDSLFFHADRTSLDYTWTWGDEEIKPLTSHLDEQRRELCIPHEEWQRCLSVYDSGGNELDFPCVLSAVDFPLRVKFPCVTHEGLARVVDSSTGERMIGNGEPKYAWALSGDCQANPTGGAGIFRVPHGMPLDPGQSFESHGSHDAVSNRMRLAPVLEFIRNLCIASYEYNNRNAMLAACHPAKPTRHYQYGGDTPVLQDSEARVSVLNFRLTMECGIVHQSEPFLWWGDIPPRCRALIAYFLGIIPDQAGL